MWSKEECSRHAHRQHHLFWVQCQQQTHQLSNMLRFLWKKLMSNLPALSRQVHLNMPQWRKYYVYKWATSCIVKYGLIKCACVFLRCITHLFQVMCSLKPKTISDFHQHRANQCQFQPRQLSKEGWVLWLNIPSLAWASRHNIWFLRGSPLSPASTTS